MIAIQRSGTHTVAARLLIRAGSRYDGLHPGKAHFLEHMLFRGTRSRSPRDIFAAIEAKGGEINANTTREYISVHTVTQAHDLPLSLEILADIFIQPALAVESFLNEKLVILQELMRAKNRLDMLSDLFVQTLWLRHPLRNPILGNPESLRDLEYETVRDFYLRRYVAGNALLVICGDIEIATSLALARTHFDAFPPGPEQIPMPVEEPPPVESRRAHINKDILQTYLLIGVPTYGMKHQDRSPLKVIELALGMGGSGRLYQRLREEQGLVYSVNTLTANYEDAGFLGVRAICDPENVEAVLEAILTEWNEISHEGISKLELEAVKGNYAGTLARRFETNLAVASIFGVEGLLYQAEPFDEAVARIEAVTQEEVLEAGQKYLSQEHYVFASMGPESTSVAGNDQN